LHHTEPNSLGMLGSVRYGKRGFRFSSVRYIPNRNRLVYQIIRFVWPYGHTEPIYTTDASVQQFRIGTGTRSNQILIIGPVPVQENFQIISSLKRKNPEFLHDNTNIFFICWDVEKFPKNLNFKWRELKF
jgi:hypothetical protein